MVKIMLSTTSLDRAYAASINENIYQQKKTSLILVPVQETTMPGACRAVCCQFEKYIYLEEEQWICYSTALIQDALCMQDTFNLY